MLHRDTRKSIAATVSVVGVSAGIIDARGDISMKYHLRCSVGVRSICLHRRDDRAMRPMHRPSLHCLSFERDVWGF